MPQLAQEIQQYLRTNLARKLSGNEKSQIRQSLAAVAGNTSLLDLYRNFYRWFGREDLFQMQSNVLEYADVFPLLYCKIRFEGMQPYQQVKHLVIDEMQDYTPIQYAVLSWFFPGKKTILGDASQGINLYSSMAADIEKAFPQAYIIKLTKSYRSTWEIARFSLHIQPNPDLQAMERHGPVPEVKRFDQSAKEEAAIRQQIDSFRSSDRRMLAILCKTPVQAKTLHSLLEAPDVYLLTEESTHFKEGVVITSIPLAKGLEFDEVIVPFASADQYHTASDQNLLYVACTRAMHQLTVTFTKEGSPFLKG